MYKFPKEIDREVDKFIRLVIREVKKEKGINITEHVNNVIKKRTKADQKERKQNGLVKKCEFIYKSPRQNKITGGLYEKGDQCINDAYIDERYCLSHRWNKQHLLLAAAEEEERKRKENHINGINGVDDIEEPDPPLQEYYPDPDKELTHLYDDIYSDTANIIVTKNRDKTSKHKWILVCKSKISPLGKRNFIRFPETQKTDLENQRLKRNYNYIIDDSFFSEVVPDKLTLKDYRNRNSDDDRY